MEHFELTIQEALGELNEHEKKNAPKDFLFVRGKKELLRKSPKVSIIGSRKASALGLDRAKKITSSLVKHNVVIVSGLAEGIDTMAHKTAIKNGGETIAVIGTSIEKYFPIQNRELQEQIAREHCLVSQFRDNSRKKKNFVIRNRLMALISDVTIIIEASEKSGTIHQAWEALRLARPLYIPASLIEDEKLTWPKELLEYGAKVLDKQSFEELIINLESLAYSEERELCLI